MEQLLTTKIFIPHTRPNFVPRPRLIDRLNEGCCVGRKLTLISAPAGFGKTTLISEWVNDNLVTSNGESQSGYRIAWLSLDEDDNDPIRFLTYFIGALKQVEGMDATLGEDTLGILKSPQPPSIQAILTPLINEIAAIPGNFILVLDDYHIIDSSQVDEVLSFLLEYLPPQFHLVIATREDPYLSLSRLRARGELVELRAADLRFTSSEATEFLNQVMGLNLSAKDIAALETRTEGWIAGLQLAAISMQGHEDTTSLIKSFTGSHRFVLDYLIEEVLEQQPESVQTFLLQTSILSQLNGSLCDAVCIDCIETPSSYEGTDLTRPQNGQAILETLEHANLFIVPLDHERRWYRYHHLFAELLQQRLKITYPQLINDLHSKAVVWYEANGYLSEAIHHALAGDDIKTATRLIEKGALDALERSDFSFIFTAVDRLPEHTLESAPWLFVYHTWALILIGRVDFVVPRLENTDWLLDSVADDEIKKREMLGHIAGLKEHLAGWQRDYTNILDYANQALEYLPEDHWIRGYCAMGMGTVFWGNGDLAASKKTFIEASSIGKASGNKRVAVTSAGYVGLSLELEGHLQQAVEHYKDSFQLVKQDGRELPLAAYLNVDFSRILYELNELNLASAHLLKGIEQCQHLSDGRVEKIGHYLLSRMYLAQGDFAEASNSIKNGVQAHPGTEASFDMRGAEYPQIRLWLKQKKHKEIGAWLDESGIDLQTISHFKTKLTYTMHARVLIALGREHPDGTYLNDALDLLAELLEMAQSNGWGNKVIEILALQALAFDTNGDRVQAMVTMERALTLAEPEGFVRTFVDEGPPMADLLREAMARRITPDYVQRLLATFSVAEPEQADIITSQPDQSELVEPLSERELEVLQLIAEGLTNPEIASRLYLSLNTVKAHTRNIYGKLDVHNRTQAIARSQEFGLLSHN